MRTCWLANIDPSQNWAHRTWPEFAGSSEAADTVVILPVHGFSATEDSEPCDLEELHGSEWLRQALGQCRISPAPVVLPPLRFVLATRSTGLFGIDPETAHALVREIAQGVKKAGFQKLVFFNTNSASEPFVATAAIDLRADLGLRTYVMNARALGLAVSAQSENTEAIRLTTSLLTEIAEHHSAKQPPPAPGLLGPDQPFPSYRSHYLPAFSRAELAALPAKDQVVIILPTGAIEQHGPHLPVGVDAILGQALLHEALVQVAGRVPVYIAPPITFGKSNEHANFPGTLWISAGTLRRLVLAIARQLKELGFRRLAIFNTHGGNSAVLAYTIQELRDMHGLDATMLRHGFKPQVSTQEAAWGFHADEWETSLMLACAPSLVHMDRAVCEYPALLDAPGKLRPERAPATFAWITEDISQSGVMGDATTATLEKGQFWLRESARRLADRIIAIAGPNA